MSIRGMFGNINRALGSTTPQQRAQMLAIAGGSSPSPTMGNALYGQSQAIMQALQDEQRLKAQAEQAEQDRRLRMSEGAADRDQRMSELDANIKWKTLDAKEQAALTAQDRRDRLEQDKLRTGYAAEQAGYAAENTRMAREIKAAEEARTVARMARLKEIIAKGQKDNPYYDLAVREWNGFGNPPAGRFGGIDLGEDGNGTVSLEDQLAVDDYVNNGGPKPKESPAQTPVPAQVAPTPAKTERAAPAVVPRPLVYAPPGTGDEYQARIRAQAAVKMAADLRELKQKVNRGLIAPALQGMQQPYYGPTGVAPEEWGD